MPVVLISGGSGMIGRNLTRHLLARGYEVIILSRDKNRTSDHPKISYSYWDIHTPIIDIAIIKKADHIIHLAGAGVMDKKWTAGFQKKIQESRTKSAELLITTLRKNEHHVKSFISSSAIGWYGSDPEPLPRKEGFIETDLPAKDFLGETCLFWEASAETAKNLGIRLVKLRTGIVLSNDGGTIKEYKKLLHFGIAAIFGNGKQMVSWIHIDDISRMYCEAIENTYMHGVYNAVAPTPISQKYLTITLAQKVRKAFYIPIYIPSLILKLFLGKRSIEILKSTTVCNKKIKGEGFTFLYPTIESATNELAKH
ncbi:MAG: TIGR01777 family oxidoreductase [Bacteroidota bacterium]|nr:TIGR01777 family oxidoreductase [Bacteroidota bacterium]